MMEIEEDKVVRDADQDARLGRAIEGIVRRELELSEGRQKVRLDAVVDDIRSELRALRRMDEALDAKDMAHGARMDVVETQIKQINALNAESIRASVHAAVAQIFSPLRVLSAFGLLLGVVIGGLTVASQLGLWSMG